MQKERVSTDALLLRWQMAVRKPSSQQGSSRLGDRHWGAAPQNESTTDLHDSHDGPPERKGTQAVKAGALEPLVDILAPPLQGSLWVPFTQCAGKEHIQTKLKEPGYE